MTRNEVRNDYFTWLYDMVCCSMPRRFSYKKLLMYLHTVEFEYVLPRDRSRASDGEELRYRFARMQPHDDLVECILDYLDEPCSVLEMMVALSVRCEEQIMDDPRYGDRTGQWFWGMIVNMGLGNMRDEKFDKAAVELAVNTLLTRSYDQDGRGGLFTVEDATQDLRNVEIWHQMLWYTNTIS